MSKLSVRNLMMVAVAMAMVMIPSTGFAWDALTGGDHQGEDWTLTDGMQIAGTHSNIGTFHVPSHVTIYVYPESMGSSYGYVEIHAQEVIVDGVINGDGAGYRGGDGGVFGYWAWENHAARGGGGGGSGGYPGMRADLAGLGGDDGGNGSYANKDCGGLFCIGNDDGYYGGGGGGGPAAGAGYATAGCGAPGTGESGWGFAGRPYGGSGGAGQSSGGSIYGAANSAQWIARGSGGGGAAGSGGAWPHGRYGGKGGAGGAMIILDAKGNYIQRGLISVNGADGNDGGGGVQTGIDEGECCPICFGYCNYYAPSGSGGGGGGGAAGSVLISGYNVTVDSPIDAALFEMNGGLGGAGGVDDAGPAYTGDDGAGGGAGRVMMYRHPSGTTTCEGSFDACPASVFQAQGCQAGEVGSLYAAGVMVKVNLLSINDLFDPGDPGNLWNGTAYPQVEIYVDDWPYFNLNGAAGFDVYVVPHIAHKMHVKKYEYDATEGTRYEFLYWSHGGARVQTLAFTADTNIVAHWQPDDPYIWNGHVSDDWNTPNNWTYRNKMVCDSGCGVNPDCKACGAPDFGRNVVIADVMDSRDSRKWVDPDGLNVAPFDTTSPHVVEDDWDEDPGHCIGNDHGHSWRIRNHLADCGWDGQTSTNCTPICGHSYHSGPTGGNGPRACGHWNYQCNGGNCAYGMDGDCAWFGNNFHGWNDTCGMLGRSGDYFCRINCTTARCGMGAGEEGNVSTLVCNNNWGGLGNSCQTTCTGSPPRNCTKEDFNTVRAISGCSAVPNLPNQLLSSQDHPCIWGANFWTNEGCACGDYEGEFSCADSALQTGRIIGWQHGGGSFFPRINEANAEARGAFVMPGACIMWEDSSNAHLHVFRDMTIYGAVGRVAMGDANGDGYATECVYNSTRFTQNPRLTVGSSAGGALRIKGYQNASIGPELETNNGGTAYLDGMNVQIYGGIEVDYCGQLKQNDPSNPGSLSFVGGIDSDIVVEIAAQETNGGPVGNYNLQVIQMILAKDTDAQAFRISDSEFGRSSFMPNNYIETFIVNRGSLNPNGRQMIIDKQVIVGSANGGRLDMDVPGSNLTILGNYINPDAKLVVQEQGFANISAGLVYIGPEMSYGETSSRALHITGGEMVLNDGGTIIMSNKVDSSAWSVLVDGGALTMNGGSMSLDAHIRFTGGSFTGTGGSIITGTDYKAGGDLYCEGGINFDANPDVTILLSGDAYFSGGTYAVANYGPRIETAGGANPANIYLTIPSAVIGTLHVNKDTSVQYAAGDQTTAAHMGISEQIYIEDSKNLTLFNTSLHLNGKAALGTPALLDAYGRLILEGTAAGNSVITGPDATELRYRMTIHNGGLIAAQYYAFENMSQYGILVEDGATIDPSTPFTNCTFRNPDTNSSGSVMLRVDNSQHVWLSQTAFEAPVGIQPCNCYLGKDAFGEINTICQDPDGDNPPDCSAIINIAKLIDHGTVNVQTEIGNLAGEMWDNDVYNRVNWPASTDPSANGVLISANLLDDTPLNSEHGHFNVLLDPQFVPPFPDPSVVEYVPPTNDEYLVQDSITGNYVQVDGTLGASEYWADFDAWGGAPGLNAYVPDNTSYQFRVKARARVDYDEIVTAPGTCTNDDMCKQGSPPPCAATDTCYCDLDNNYCVKELVSYLPAGGSGYSNTTLAILTPDRTAPPTPDAVTTNVITEPNSNKYVGVSWTGLGDSQYYYLGRVADYPGAEPASVNGFSDNFEGVVLNANWVQNTGTWSVGNFLLNQEVITGYTALNIVDESSIDDTNSLITVSGMKTAGTGGLVVYFKWHAGAYAAWEIGADANTVSRVIGIANEVESEKAVRLDINRTYQIRIMVTGDTARGFLNDIPMWRLTRTAAEITGTYAGMGLGTNNATAHFAAYRAVSLADVNLVRDYDARDYRPPNQPLFLPEDVVAQSTTSLQVNWDNAIADVGSDYYYYVVAVDDTGNESNLLKNEGFEFRSDVFWQDGGGVPNTMGTLMPQSGYHVSSFDFIDASPGMAIAMGQEVPIDAAATGYSYHFSRWAHMTDYFDGAMIPAYMYVSYGDGSDGEAYSDIITTILPAYREFHSGFEPPAGGSVQSILATTYHIIYGGSVPKYLGWVDSARLQRMKKANVQTGFNYVVVEWRTPSAPPELASSWHILQSTQGASVIHASLSPNTQRYYRLTACDYNGMCSPYIGDFGRFTFAEVPPDPDVDWTPTFDSHGLKVTFDDSAPLVNPPGTDFAVQCSSCSPEQFVDYTSGLFQGSEDWSSARDWEPSSLDSHETYCFRIKARNGDGIETALSPALDRCRRPAGRVSLDGPITVRKGVLGSAQPTLKVDGLDVQEIMIPLTDPNGADDIENVRARVSVNGCILNGGNCTYTDSRGYFMWDKNTGEFTERTPTTNGNDMVTLRIEGTNCTSDCSEVVVVGDSLVVRFRYTLDLAYGDIQDNGVSIRVQDTDALVAPELLIDWNEAIADFDFHTSMAPPDPFTDTFDGIAAAPGVDVGWINNNQPELFARSAVESNQIANFYDGGDMVYYQFRVSTDPSCDNNFAYTSGIPWVDTNPVGAELIGSHIVATPLPDNHYYWCAVSRDHHLYGAALDEYWESSHAQPAVFHLDTSPPVLNKFTLLARTHSNPGLGHIILPSPFWHFSSTFYFSWDDMTNTGAGPHSPLEDHYYFGIGLSEMDADPKYNTEGTTNPADGSKYAAIMQPNKGVYFCVRGKDEAGNWSVDQDGLDKPICQKYNIEYTSISAPTVKSPSHPDPDQEYCTADDPDGVVSAEAYTPHICWDWFECNDDADCIDKQNAQADPDDFDIAAASPCGGDGYCVDDAGRPLCDPEEPTVCVSGVKAYSFMMNLDVSGTPDNQLEDPYEPADNPCDPDWNVCRDSQPYYDTGLQEEYSYTFNYPSSFTPSQDAAAPTNNHDIRYYMNNYPGNWVFSVTARCDATFNEDQYVESSKAIFDINICTAPKENKKRTRMVVPTGVASVGGTEMEVPEFYIDVREVTNSDYRKCVKRGPCPDLSPDQRMSATRNDYYDNMKYAKYPVVNVTWDAAQAYCQWIGDGEGRLPTEAEMIRASDHYYGKFIDSRTTLRNDQVQIGDTISVNNEYGPGTGMLINLLSNVSEWTHDWAAPEEYLLPEGMADQAQCRAICASMGKGFAKELCDNDCRMKVVRGASFQDSALGIYHRRLQEPALGDAAIGFRCVIPVTEVREKMESQKQVPVKAEPAIEAGIEVEPEPAVESVGVDETVSPLTRNP